MPDNAKDALWIVVAGIASSLGAVAALTGLGGLLIAARLEAAGLPTEIAVAAIPKPVLLTLGVEVALPLVITSALVGGVVAAMHGLSRGLGPGVSGWRLGVPLLAIVVGTSILAVIVVNSRNGSRLAMAATASSGLALAVWAGILTRWRLDDDQPVKKERIKKERAMLAAVGIAVTAAGFAYEAVVAEHTRHLWLIAIILGVGVLVSLVAIWVLTSHWAEAAVMSLVVLAVAGSIAWIRTHDNPKARPVAAVRITADRRIVGLIGIYVAATKEDLFLARVRLACDKPKQGDNLGSVRCDAAHDLDRTGDLVVLPRKDFAEIAVGTNVSLAKVTCRAHQLLDEVLIDTETGAGQDHSAVTARGSQALGEPVGMPAPPC
jgi:hypothetical protein